MRTCILRTPYEIDQIKLAWNKLADATQAAPQAYPWWALACDAEQRLIVTVSDGDKLVALGAFNEVAQRLIRTVSFLEVPGGQTNRLLMAPGYDKALPLLWNRLWSPTRRLRLVNLARGANLDSLLASRWKPTSNIDCEPMITVDTSKGLDEILASRSPNLRGQLRKGHNRAAAVGDTLTFQVAHTPTEVQRILPIVAKVAAYAKFDSRTHELLAMGALCQQISTAVMLDRGWIIVLFANVEPIAYQIGILSHDTIIAWQTGYNPDYSRISPGHLCVAHLLQLAHGNGYRTVDLGKRMAYKQAWSDTTYGVTNITAEATSLTAPLLGALTRIENRLSTVRHSQ